MPASLDHRRLYRLPWSLPDNAIAWLEPTAKCNLACEGCYRTNVTAHKPLAEVAADLDVFERCRTARMIAARRLSHLAVMQSGKLIGLLRAEDLSQEVAAY